MQDSPLGVPAEEPIIAGLSAAVVVVEAA